MVTATGKQRKAAPKAAVQPKPKSAPKAAGKAVTKPTKGKGRATCDSEGDFDSSDPESGSENEGESSQAAMLAALQAHGMAMFGMGGASASASASADEDEDDDGESDGNGTVLESDDDEGFHTDDGWGAEDGFVTDSEDELGAIDAAFASKKKNKGKGKAKEDKEKESARAAPVHVVPEVVFAPTRGKSLSLVSNSEKRAFMKGNSAKMMGIKNEEVAVGRGKKRAREAEEEDDASNLRLDKTLHDMLLTTILPEAQSDAASRPVDKRNAMSGRLLELASYSIPGEGSARVKGQNLSSHPAAVRTGLMHAKARREENARAEAESAGSWVKGIGGLGDMGMRGAGIRPSGGNAARGARTFGLEVGKKKGMGGKKQERARGLGMGFGSYKNGTLTISESEINRVNNLGKGGVRKKGKRK